METQKPDREMFAWAAGVFDGEGCVNLGKTKSSGKRPASVVGGSISKR